jgi:hypothetical protein
MINSGYFQIRSHNDLAQNKLKKILPGGCFSDRISIHQGQVSSEFLKASSFLLSQIHGKWYHSAVDYTLLAQGEIQK